MIFSSTKPPQRILPCAARKTVPLTFPYHLQATFKWNFIWILIFKVIFSATFWLVSVVSTSLCLCCHTDEKNHHRTTRAVKEETHGHEGWLLPANLDFFHSQLKLFKTGAPGLSKLDSCRPDGDDWVWRVGYPTLHQYEDGMYNLFPWVYSKIHSSWAGNTHPFRG